jgi:hypothetical protein
MTLLTDLGPGFTVAFSRLKLVTFNIKKRVWSKPHWSGTRVQKVHAAFLAKKNRVSLRQFFQKKICKSTCWNWQFSLFFLFFLISVWGGSYFVLFFFHFFLGDLIFSYCFLFFSFGESYFSYFSCFLIFLIFVQMRKNKK